MFSGVYLMLWAVWLASWYPVRTEECECSSELNIETLARIAELESRINSVPNLIGNQMGMIITQLSTVFSQYQEEIEGIKNAIETVTDNSGFSEAVEYIQQQMNTTTFALNTLQNKIASQEKTLEAFMEEQNEKTKELEERLEQQEENEEEQEKEEEKDDDKKDQTVAFFVTFHREYSNTPLFKTAVTNVGNAYDLDNGVFSCPTAGIYLFTFTVQTVSGLNVHCHIAVNNQVVAYAQTSHTYADTSSVTAILNLSVGDDVTLTECSNWSGAYSSEGTTFGGVLIQKTT